MIYEHFVSLRFTVNFLLKHDKLKLTDSAKIKLPRQFILHVYAWDLSKITSQLRKIYTELKSLCSLLTNYAHH